MSRLLLGGALCVAVLLGASTSFAALHAKGGAAGPGGTVHLSASPNGEISYNKKKLISRPGKVTIRFANTTPLTHNVAIENRGGKVLVESDLIAKGKTSISAKLRRGTYTFFCVVPGHREAGMEGTLKVR